MHLHDETHARRLRPCSPSSRCSSSQQLRGSFSRAALTGTGGREDYPPHSIITSPRSTSPDSRIKHHRNKQQGRLRHRNASTLAAIAAHERILQAAILPAVRRPRSRQSSNALRNLRCPRLLLDREILRRALREEPLHPHLAKAIPRGHEHSAREENHQLAAAAAAATLSDKIFVVNPAFSANFTHTVH